ncbi:DUF2945 domain-containing protein [Pseudarthrobacter sp. 1C304]|uniref:DUF2945 domain-containing protein n=1 Tax=Pseudarthrobacter sp. 1C304 TaxID=3457438 RepID=UPI003FD5DB39
MSLSKSLSQGTPVEWNTPQGTTHGKIVEKKIKDFELDGNTHRASEDEPQYVVESAKTGARAAHKASALTEKK